MLTFWGNCGVTSNFGSPYDTRMVDNMCKCYDYQSLGIELRAAGVLGRLIDLENVFDNDFEVVLWIKNR